jgi:hypothetical protein
MRIEELAHGADRFAIRVAVSARIQKGDDRLERIIIRFLEARMDVQRAPIFRKRDDAAAILLETDAREPLAAAAREDLAEVFLGQQLWRCGKIDLELNSPVGTALHKLRENSFEQGFPWYFR